MIVHMAKYNVSTDVKWSVEPYYCDCCCLKQFELQSFPCFNVSMIKCTKLYYFVFLEYYRLFDLNCWLELWYGQKKCFVSFLRCGRLRKGRFVIDLPRWPHPSASDFYRAEKRHSWMFSSMAHHKTQISGYF